MPANQSSDVLDHQQCQNGYTVDLPDIDVLQEDVVFFGPDVRSPSQLRKLVDGTSTIVRLGGRSFEIS